MSVAEPGQAPVPEQAPAPESAPVPAARRRSWLLVLPVVFFAGLAAIFLISLESGGDPSYIPSALIGKPAPEFDLPALAGTSLPGFKRADLLGKVTVVNIFASWCVPCRLEHPIFSALASDPRVRLVGINYKDSGGDALSFLTDLGDPYAAIGVDSGGRSAIDWGVYGVPETFIVGPDGVIRYKFVGPIDERSLANVVRPQIDKAAAR